MTLIGRSVEPRDRWHSAYYRNDIKTGRARKCRPVMRKMQEKHFGNVGHVQLKQTYAMYLHVGLALML